MMQGGEIFIPRIPSMKIVDLARAIAPDAGTYEIGIRPGEKMHEEMISVGDSSRTLLFGDRYIIMPTIAEWGYKTPEGNPVPNGFSYQSDSNDLWLSVEDIRKQLGLDA
jgi:UDP-N-acetylglucosamine 4,6-dehydratase